ncbi:hypothetical protein MC7420_3211 [Coleofasciculus chthonoplastes PCC 7420]|uniref:Uncharacterized protein n=1 Tax=Coleofasciculus chthonoplastes PCC 7420 TaxID=118168 RepID=B4VZ40_9CYAN|nr:hypothetical protein MC7420_3211 [Coleofasciculus chthonoplastes PCC 7420]
MAKLTLQSTTPETFLMACSMVAAQEAQPIPCSRRWLVSMVDS